jgi:hypothetical protein
MRRVVFLLVRVFEWFKMRKRERQTKREKEGGG